MCGKTTGKKKMVPKTNAYVVTANASYLSRSFFPTIEYIAQQNAERRTSKQPTMNWLLKIIFSFDDCANITTITPKKDKMIPRVFLKEKTSFKNSAERITMKITLALIKTDDVDAVVYSIPIN